METDGIEYKVPASRPGSTGTSNNGTGIILLSGGNGNDQPKNRVLLTLTRGFYYGYL
jgi:hypothetical protein